MLVQFQNYNTTFTAKYPRIQKSDLKECIKAGYSYKQISEKFEVPIDVVIRSMNWFGLKSNRAIEMEKNIHDVLNLHRQGFSVTQIKKELTLRTHLVKNIIKKYEKSKSVSEGDSVLADIVKKLNMSEEDLKKYLK